MTMHHKVLHCRSTIPVPEDSPITGDLGMVAAVLYASCHHHAHASKAARAKRETATDDEARAAVMYEMICADSGFATCAGIIASIAGNLPVHLQAAFFEATGCPEDMAESLLAEIRQGSAKLDKMQNNQPQ